MSIHSHVGPNYLFYAFHFLIILHLTFNSSCIFACLYVHYHSAAGISLNRSPTNSTLCCWDFSHLESYQIPYSVIGISFAHSPTKFDTPLLGFSSLGGPTPRLGFPHLESYQIPDSIAEIFPTLRPNFTAGISPTQSPTKFYTQLLGFSPLRGQNSQLGLPPLRG